MIGLVGSYWIICLLLGGLALLSEDGLNLFFREDPYVLELMIKLALTSLHERTKTRRFPFSHFLSFVADVFTKMLFEASRHGLIECLMLGVIPRGIISLQYSDDSMIPYSSLKK
jgi:hypothetical protein